MISKMFGSEEKMLLRSFGRYSKTKDALLKHVDNEDKQLISWPVHKTWTAGPKHRIVIILL